MEKLGRNKVMLKCDSEPAVLALQTAVMRETSVETAMEEQVWEITKRTALRRMR